jgi:hypothetical protein
VDKLESTGVPRTYQSTCRGPRKLAGLCALGMWGNDENGDLNTKTAILKLELSYGIFFGFGGNWSSSSLPSICIKYRSPSARVMPASNNGRCISGVCRAMKT